MLDFVSSRVVYGENYVVFFFFQAEDGIRDRDVTGVQSVLSDLGRHISRLQTIWDLHSAKWMQGRYTQRFRPGIKVPKIGMESEDYPSPSKKGGPTVSLP